MPDQSNPITIGDLATYGGVTGAVVAAFRWLGGYAAKAKDDQVKLLVDENKALIEEAKEDRKAHAAAISEITQANREAMDHLSGSIDNLAGKMDKQNEVVWRMLESSMSQRVVDQCRTTGKPAGQGDAK